jgi:hypothetical protein
LSKKIFILEDDHTRIGLFLEAIGHYNVDIGTSVQEAQLNWRPPYDLILLDHDLGGEQMSKSEGPNTGYQFAKWMGKPEFQPIIIIHSYNPDGAKKMEAVLKENGWRWVSRIPFGLTVLNYIKKEFNEHSKGPEGDSRDNP